MSAIDQLEQRLARLDARARKAADPGQMGLFGGGAGSGQPCGDGHIAADLTCHKNGGGAAPAKGKPTLADAVASQIAAGLGARDQMIKDLKGYGIDLSAEEQEELLTGDLADMLEAQQLIAAQKARQAPAPKAQRKPAAAPRVQGALGVDRPTTNSGQDLAQRMANAATRLRSSIAELGGLGEEDARLVADFYLAKAREGGAGVAKLDPVDGQFKITHGSFLDRDALKRALPAAKAWKQKREGLTTQTAATPQQQAQLARQQQQAAAAAGDKQGELAWKKEERTVERQRIEAAIGASQQSQQSLFGVTEYDETMPLFRRDSDPTAVLLGGLLGEQLEGAQVLDWERPRSGIHAGRVSADGLVYRFRIDSSRVAFRPAWEGLSEAEWEARSMGFLQARDPNARVDFKRVSFEQRSGKRKCSVGYSCGRSCIAMAKECQITPSSAISKQRLRALQALAKEGGPEFERKAAEVVAGRHAKAVQLKEERNVGQLKKLLQDPKVAEMIRTGKVPEGGEKKRSRVQDVSPNDIEVDAARFQYKLNSSATGEVGSLSGVKKWDPNLAGVISVWEDPADGKTYVINGHNRLALARRMGAEEITVRYLDAPDAKHARAIGAMQNIAEGQGTEIDAAKFFRDTGIRDLKGVEAAGLPLRSGKAQKGLALQGLPEGLFQAVVQGQLSINRGAIIGGSGLSEKKQAEVHRMLKSNRSMTDGTLQEYVAAAFASESRKQGVLDVFGTEEEQDNLLERSKLAASLKSKLSREKRLFGLVSRSRAAEELEAKAGNQINTTESARVSAEAAQVMLVFDSLKNSPGPVSDALNAAANRIKKGEKEAKVRKELEAAVMQGVEDELRRMGIATEKRNPAEELGASMFDSAAARLDAIEARIDAVTTGRGGQPCGKGHISPDFQCHIGSAMPTPGKSGVPKRAKGKPKAFTSDQTEKGKRARAKLESITDDLILSEKARLSAFREKYGLTQLEAGALAHYSDKGYIAMNILMRGKKPKAGAYKGAGGERSGPVLANEAIVAMESAMKKLPKHTGPLERGIRVPYEEIDGFFTAGETYSDPAFQSASTKGNKTPGNYGTVFSHRAIDYAKATSQGNNALNTVGVTLYITGDHGGRFLGGGSSAPTEGEVLIPRGQEFRVKRVRKMPMHVMVDLEAVPRATLDSRVRLDAIEARLARLDAGPGTGKACGDGHIAAGLTCHKGTGGTAVKSGMTTNDIKYPINAQTLGTDEAQAAATRHALAVWAGEGWTIYRDAQAKRASEQGLELTFNDTRTVEEPSIWPMASAEKLEALERVFNLPPLEGAIYRGIDLNPDHRLDNPYVGQVKFIEDLESGKLNVTSTSWTANPETVGGFLPPKWTLSSSRPADANRPVVLKIKSNKLAVPISDAIDNTTESEALMPPNVRYRIVAVANKELTQYQRGPAWDREALVPHVLQYREIEVEAIPTEWTPGINRVQRKDSAASRLAGGFDAFGLKPCPELLLSGGLIGGWSDGFTRFLRQDHWSGEAVHGAEGLCVQPSGRRPQPQRRDQQQARLDAIEARVIRLDKNCVKGKACGNSCVPANRNCRTPGQAAAAPAQRQTPASGEDSPRAEKDPDPAPAKQRPDAGGLLGAARNAGRSLVRAIANKVGVQTPGQKAEAKAQEAQAAEQRRQERLARQKAEDDEIRARGPQKWGVKKLSGAGSDGDGTIAQRFEVQLEEPLQVGGRLADRLQFEVTAEPTNGKAYRKEIQALGFDFPDEALDSAVEMSWATGTGTSGFLSSNRMDLPPDVARRFALEVSKEVKGTVATMAEGQLVFASAYGDDGYGDKRRKLYERSGFTFIDGDVGIAVVRNGRITRLSAGRGDRRDAADEIDIDTLVQELLKVGPDPTEEDPEMGESGGEDQSTADRLVDVLERLEQRLSRLDARVKQVPVDRFDKNCVKGKACGNSCVPKTRNCRTSGQPAAAPVQQQAAAPAAAPAPAASKTKAKRPRRRKKASKPAPEAAAAGTAEGMAPAAVAAGKAIARAIAGPTVNTERSPELKQPVLEDKYAEATEKAIDSYTQTHFRAIKKHQAERMIAAGYQIDEYGQKIASQAAKKSKRKGLGDLGETVDLIERFVARAPKYEGEVSRGMRFESQEDALRFIEGLSKGQAVTGSMESWAASGRNELGFDPANVFAGRSASPDKILLAGVSVKLVQANKHGASVAGYSVHAHEQEILQPAGIRYRVLSVKERIIDPGKVNVIPMKKGGSKDVIEYDVEVEAVEYQPMPRRIDSAAIDSLEARLARLETLEGRQRG